MESEQETSLTDTDDQLSTSGSDSPSKETGTVDETIWDRIQRITWIKNKVFWSKLLIEDKLLFRMRFKECFIESCKHHLYLFYEFIENDEIWNVLMETKSQLFEETTEDDEAFFLAVDKRKYKLLKTIDWEQIESDLKDDESSETSETANSEDGEYESVPVML